MPVKLFKAKKHEMRQQHNAILDSQVMYLSDEIDTCESLNDKQVKLLGEKLLGYQKDYFHVSDDDAEGQAPEPKKKKDKSAAESIKPLDFTLINSVDLFNDGQEFYIMQQKKLEKVDCQTCKLIYDYTNIIV